MLAAKQKKGSQKGHSTCARNFASSASFAFAAALAPSAIALSDCVGVFGVTFWGLAQAWSVIAWAGLPCTVSCPSWGTCVAAAACHTAQLLLNTPHTAHSPMQPLPAATHHPGHLKDLAVVGADRGGEHHHHRVRREGVLHLRTVEAVCAQLSR